VHGGRIVTASDVYEAAVAIRGEKIVAIGPPEVLPPAARTIDARGKYVLPGAIDCHIHLGPEYDDWRGGPIAAAHAGLTTLLGFGLYAKAAKELGWKNIFVDPEGKPIPFGSPSVETMVPLMYSEGVGKRGLPISWMARVLAENPARIFGLYPRKGVIQIGADADLLILDPEPETTITVADHRGMAGFTLYEGWQARGRPWMTLLRGRVLLNQGKLEQAPGYGRYLPRGRPVPPIGGAVR